MRQNFTKNKIYFYLSFDVKAPLKVLHYLILGFKHLYC